MDGARARVLVAVSPVVLEGAFATILHAIGVDDVVQFHEATAAERAGRFGTAIASADLVAAVEADVVITLPDVAGAGEPAGTHRAHITSGDGRVEVDIRDERKVLDLLAEHVPLASSRRSALLPVDVRPSA